MTRLIFLLPAAIAGGLVATGALALSMGSTATYVLAGLVGGLLVVAGIISDFQVPKQQSKAVKVQEPAVFADQRYGPEAGVRLKPFEVLPERGWDTNQVRRDTPFSRSAGGAPLYSFLVKKRKKVIDIRYGHRIDPIRTGA